MKVKYIYLLLSVCGICFTWYYNIQWFQTVEDPSIINFFGDINKTFAGKSINADLSVVLFVNTHVILSYTSRRNFATNRSSRKHV